MYFLFKIDKILTKILCRNIRKNVLKYIVIVTFIFKGRKKCHSLN